MRLWRLVIGSPSRGAARTSLAQILRRLPLAARLNATRGDMRLRVLTTQPPQSA